MKYTYTVLLLISFLFLAFLLGSRMLLAGDFLYLSDQGRDMLLVKDIALNHNLTLLGTHSGLGGFFHGPLWLYMLVPVFFLGQGNPIFFAIFYVMLALIVVIAGFLVGKLLYNTRFGLLVAFFLAINTRIFGYINSTQGVNVLPLVYLGILYGCITFIRGKKSGFVIAIFFIGLALQFETASSLLLIALIPVWYFLCIVLKHLFSKGNIIVTTTSDFREYWKDHIKIILLSSIVFCISIATFILFDIRHQFLMSKSFFQYLGVGERATGYLEFSQRLLQHLQSFFGIYTSLLFDQQNLFLLLLFIVILAASWIVLSKRKDTFLQKREFLFYIFFPILLFMLFLFYPYPIYPEYVIGLTIPAIFLFVLAIQINLQTQIGKIFIFLFFLITFFSIGNTLTQLYGRPYIPNQTSGSYKNQLHIVDWIFQDAQGKKIGYFVYTPETFTYGLDYLFWWRGTKQHKHIPTSQKVEQTYLLLSPPLQNDVHAHQFWKDNVIHVQGKIQKQKNFPGGVIVEKYKPIKNETPEEAHYHQNLIFR